MNDFSVVSFCGRGNVRPENEDNVSIDGTAIEHERIVQTSLSGDEDHLVVLADGMGGHAKGEVASSLTTKYISECWRRDRMEFRPLEAVRAANHFIFDRMREDAQLRGMGATVVGAHFSGKTLSWFNVGDSRGYRFKDGILSQLTVDHVPKGGVPGFGGRNHAITQAVGGSAIPTEVWPAIGSIKTQLREVYLFCTDGLTDTVSDNAIALTLQKFPSLADSAQALLTTAVANGAPDNISFVIVARIDVMENGAS